MNRHFVCFIFVLSWVLGVQAQTRHYDFAMTRLGDEWRYVRQVDSSKYVVCDSVLRLYGNVAELKDSGAATFIGLPQTSEHVEAETLLTTFDDENGDEAGLAVYWSDSCYVQAYLNNIRGEHRIKLRFQLKSHQWMMAEQHLEHRRIEKVWFRVTCDGDFYRFYYSEDGKKYHLLESVEKMLLSPAIAQGNGELLVGMYAYTGSVKLQMGYSYADFRYFDFKTW